MKNSPPHQRGAGEVGASGTGTGRSRFSSQKKHSFALALNMGLSCKVYCVKENDPAGSFGRAGTYCLTVARKMEKGTGKDAGIRLNRENHTVMIGGEEIQLNAMEYKVLECLVKNSGVVLSRERILHLVWEYDYYGSSRLVDVYIKRLRKCFGEYRDRLVTVRKVGYMYCPA